MESDRDHLSLTPQDSHRAEVQAGGFSLPVHHHHFRAGPPTSQTLSVHPCCHTGLGTLGYLQPCICSGKQALGSYQGKHRSSQASREATSSSRHSPPGTRRGPSQEQGLRCAQSLPAHSTVLESREGGGKKVLPRNHAVRVRNHTGLGVEESLLLWFLTSEKYASMLLAAQHRGCRDTGHTSCSLSAFS